jgi:hypothetical protein
LEIHPIENVIPETNIMVFAPHYDDFLLGIGGYVAELHAKDLRSTKFFQVLLIFSRSNYQVGSGSANYDNSLARIKLATGNRLIEDLDCLDELLGARSYRYELSAENEALLRSKKLAATGMEFPYGTYDLFNAEDHQIFNRLKEQVRQSAMQADTALVFPLAIKSHIDHFITREAGITVAHELGKAARAHFYFQEDKPYAGLQNDADRSAQTEFITKHALERHVYITHPELVVRLAFKHYPSQVDDSYRLGVIQRSEELQKEYSSRFPVDQIFRFLGDAS